MWRRRCANTIGLALILGLGAGCALAGEISGSARVAYGTTESDVQESDVVDQDYTLTWVQPLTPWIGFLVSYRYNFDRTSPEGAPAFERRSEQPSLQLTYSRRNFSARLLWSDRRTRGSSPSDALDALTKLASIDWTPRRGPRFALRYRSEENVADVAVFGRETESTLLDFEVAHEAERWDLRYVFQDQDLANNLTGFRLDQQRHQLRMRYDDAFLEDRLRLSADGWFSRVDQRETAPTGADLAEPVPARDGLFAIDPTPDVGPLATTPDLVDGDTTTPVAPPIDIGGANTFRNIGLDLGFTRPVTRLELSVDGLSSAAVVWEVYASTDNLTWDPVAAVTAIFDPAFLRYTLRFPETTRRFFKAVNITANTLTGVQVTEIRALLDVPELGRADSVATTYRVNLGADVRPNERVTGLFSLGLRNEEDVARRSLSRDTDELTYDARVLIDARPDLTLLAGYRYDVFEQQAGRQLRREERRTSVGLEWSPLTAVRALARATRREESERGARLRRADTLTLNATMDIYDGLQLLSELTYSDIADPFGGFDQRSWRWVERLRAQPSPRWVVGAGSAITWLDSRGSVALSRIVTFNLFSTWQMFPYLTLTGDAGYREDDQRENLSQSWAVIWAPGPKLTASVYYRETDARGVLVTTGRGASTSYRLNRRFRLFGDLNRSRTVPSGLPATEITSARAGFFLSL